MAHTKRTGLELLRDACSAIKAAPADMQRMAVGDQDVAALGAEIESYLSRDGRPPREGR
jgi:hypothetical protein